MMKPFKEVKISSWATHTTTGVSVSLALLTLGLIAMIWMAAKSESRRMMEKIEISVVMADSIGDDRALAIYGDIEHKPYVQDISYISREAALKNWKEATGEDLEHVFGVNPLSPEIAFRVAPGYTSVKAIEDIKKSLSSIDGVEEVGAPERGMIESMNTNIRRITLGFTILAAIMLVISFVLISNTVRLSIYSKRFTIHTMQLVGATNWFIRRPFILANAGVGALSGAVAAGVLSAVLALCPTFGMEELTSLIGWTGMGILDASLIAGGTLICAFAALVATSRHLRQDYGELFR